MRANRTKRAIGALWLDSVISSGIEAELYHQSVKPVARRESKQRCGFFAGAITLLKRSPNRLTLFGQRKVVESDAGRYEWFGVIRWRWALHVYRRVNIRSCPPRLEDQRLGLNFFGAVERKRSLDHIFQFADVAGPMMSQQRGLGARR